jgi:hypothetical protein
MNSGDMPPAIFFPTLFSAGDEIMLSEMTYRILGFLSASK